MNKNKTCACRGSAQKKKTGSKTIVMVGNPNVGKSALFNRLTGTYVVVSNYPGTTVDVSRGNCRIGKQDFSIEDTPGMYSLLPITGEEQVARDILLVHQADIVLHIIDAKNLKRMLPLTLQLIEAQLPVILVLNMIDEANRLGIVINTESLEKELGISVVSTSALSGRGIDALKEKILTTGFQPVDKNINYAKPVEDSLSVLAPLMPEQCTLSQRSLALLLIQRDLEISDIIQSAGCVSDDPIEESILELEKNLKESVSYQISMTLHQSAIKIWEKVFSHSRDKTHRLSRQISEWTMNPITGIPLLFLVLYFGLYKFVGEFGAGTIVDFLEADIFEAHISPWINGFIKEYIPWQSIRELIGLEYGIITLGVRYAIAIILPIVGTFFIAFSIIEDSGYLPRLAMLVDRIFKKIGLNGRAVIPMTLGLGCDTMATMVTRTLETTRERIIATLLLALAIPCSAQFLIMKKERGLKTALTIALFIFPFSFLVGGTVNGLLNFLGVQL